jgi:uncharacterized membrane protein YcaP (DUF421 family)
METVWRVAFVYALVWACFRVVGKRELTQMTPFELVTLLFIPQLFSRALTRQDYSMTNAVIGAATLFTLVFLTSTLSHRFPRFRSVLEAKPSILIRRGELDPAVLNRERISPADIFSAMHKVGIEDLRNVEWALLEGDGKIAIIPRFTVGQVNRDTGTARPLGASD